MLAQGYLTVDISAHTIAPILYILTMQDSYIWCTYKSHSDPHLICQPKSMTLATPIIIHTTQQKSTTMGGENDVCGQLNRK